ncbi:MAG: putative glycoside hydrolase [Patescibacteria group bacterium]
MKHFLSPITLIFIGFFGLYLPHASALAPDTHYVRTANYFLKAGRDIYPEIYNALSSYDVLILPMEAAVYNKDFFNYARSKNPTITILAYVPSRSINIKDIDDGAGIRKKLKSGIQNEWYLKDSAGSIVRAWESTLPLNVTTEWNVYLPRFVHDTVMSTGMWDGILYDEVDVSISFLNNGQIDADSDGHTDQSVLLDASWKTGMSQLLVNTRELLGNNALIVINGSSHPAYQQYINGRMFESFPTPWEGNGEWQDSMRSYLALSSAALRPPLFIINSNTGNSGEHTIYQKIRFGLTSALMGNAYFGFDYGTQNHGQLWRYDEYDVNLGKPSTTPYAITHSMSSEMKPGVWRRDFQQGTVLTNSSSQLANVDLDGDFEKIRGPQDPEVNNGSIVSSISLSPSDGVILLRPLSTINNAPYYNGSFARVFDQRGNVRRNGFFAYDSSIRGSVVVYQSTLQTSIASIHAEKGTLRITKSDGTSSQFKPFGQNWNGDLNIAIDSANPEKPIIYASREYPENGTVKKKTVKGEPSGIGVFETDGTRRAVLYPLGKKFFGSLRLAIGDLNNDSSKELVVSTGAGTSPVVRIFDAHGRLLSGGFYAYQPTFTGGVSVAVAHFDSSGYGTIVTSPGKGGSPLVRVFDGKAHPLNPGFMAFSPANKGGIRVLATDVNGDNRDEIIATTAKVFTYALK